MKYSTLFKTIAEIEQTNPAMLTEKLRLELLSHILRGAMETGVNIDDYYETFREWQREDGQLVLFRRHKDLDIDGTIAVIMFYFAQERFHEGLCTDLLMDGTLLSLIKKARSFVFDTASDIV